jgi:hypothetical protein
MKTGGREENDDGNGVVWTTGICGTNNTCPDFTASSR